MTDADRAAAVTQLGFTERQARFLVLVMLHGGVCLARQYCTFARIARGQTVRDLFQQLVAPGFATAYPRAHGSTHLYHVHSKTLYRVIGEVDNRNRRPVALPRAIERVMLLDAVLDRPDLRWLATERDKVAYFSKATAVRPLELPHLCFGEGPTATVRSFPDKLPIGIEPEGRTHVFLYLVTRQSPVDFRAFLHRHAELLRALPAWTLRLLFPSHLAGTIRTYQAAVRDELATPLQADTRDELRWFFEQRRRGVEAAGVAVDVRFQRAQEAFATPRFAGLYRRWLQAGDAVLEATVSPTLAEALSRRTGTLECHVLERAYQHLAPVVGSA